MTKHLISRAWLVVSALALLGAGAPYKTSLDAEVCHAAAPKLLETLGADWQAVSGYVQDCPVLGPDGKTALSVAVVRIDRMQANRWFDKHAEPRRPLPVILDNASRNIGKLPEGFPADLPGALQVTFKDWSGGLPSRIDQYEAFETALPPHVLAAQVWDPTKRQFRQLASEP